MSGIPLTFPWQPWLTRLLLVVTVLFPFIYGLWGFERSGPLWPDAPRYANAGCMIQEAWRSGGWTQPVEFAKQNYAQYPAFSVPYHPPLYPVALGIWFQLTDCSYLSARIFTAICWSLTGLLFARLNRELGLNGTWSAASGLLLITTPQLAIWCRDTMSEVVSMPVLILACLTWLRWLKTESVRWLVVAWILLLVAFFTRLPTAGILPGLLLLTLLTPGRQWRRIVSCGIGATIYLLLGVVWVRFVNQYAAHEAVADGKGSRFLLAAWEYFITCSPGILASGSAMLSLGGFVLLRSQARSHLAIRFWFIWCCSYVFFKILMATSLEVRHFYLGVVSLVGFAAASLSIWSGLGRSLPAAVMTLGIAINLGLLLTHTPSGVVGYSAVASHITQRQEPGNILLACWEDQDLIFQIRSRSARTDRYCVRSDRTLAIRVSDYAKVEAKLVARDIADVLKLIEVGQIALIVTCTSGAEKAGDFRTPEMKLVHAAMLAHPEQFECLGRFPLRIDYVEHAHSRSGGEVQLWRNREPMRSGPPNLPIVIPTAGMSIEP